MRECPPEGACLSGAWILPRKTSERRGEDDRIGIVSLKSGSVRRRVIFEENETNGGTRVTVVERSTRVPEASSHRSHEKKSPRGSLRGQIGGTRGKKKSEKKIARRITDF